MYTTKVIGGPAKRAAARAPSQAAPRTSRKQIRRVLRKLTSLEVKMVGMGQQLPGSPNKRAQKRYRQTIKLRRAARYITGLLIRTTGAAAPELVLQSVKPASKGVF